jgi:hypothetical protein
MFPMHDPFLTSHFRLHKSSSLRVKRSIKQKRLELKLFYLLVNSGIVAVDASACSDDASDSD